MVETILLSSRYRNDGVVSVKLMAEQEQAKEEFLRGIKSFDHVLEDVNCSLCNGTETGPYPIL